MKRVSKQTLERLAGLRATIKEAAERFGEIKMQAIIDLNEQVAKANDARAEAYGVMDDECSQLEAYMDEKSDRWRDGDTGSDYSNWLSAMQDSRNVLDEEIPDVEISDDFFDGLDDAFEDFPEEP
jgi:hypothetical protein